MSLLRSKTRAWFAHLLLSLAVLLPLFLFFYLVWFPQPYFRIQSVAQVVAILIGVDLVLGPLLTFVVYRPGKKGLKFDLTVIVLLQVAALAYGVWSIQSERPEYVVFAVDRYEVLAAKDVDFNGAGLAGAPFTGEGHGPLYAFAQMPLGDAYQRFQDSVLLQGRPDLERRPEFWLPLPEGKGAILSVARPVSALMDQRPESSEALQRAVSAMGLAPESARFVPVVGKRHEFAGLLDPATARILYAVPIDDPWID